VTEEDDKALRLDSLPAEIRTLQRPIHALPLRSRCKMSGLIPPGTSHCYTFYVKLAGPQCHLDEVALWIVLTVTSYERCPEAFIQKLHEHFEIM